MGDPARNIGLTLLWGGIQSGQAGHFREREQTDGHGRNAPIKQITWGSEIW